ncbi:hypothetical protein [Wenjunlia tyrosinilytica]|uniref:hypothetical protein n=1 Tax=Wenjunlia tyrosinilytica TaxID=1544741 RepID=UPI00166ADECF|nr:hypothetical protein [Wenjunlia tyrosinilytica]
MAQAVALVVTQAVAAVVAFVGAHGRAACLGAGRLISARMGTPVSWSAFRARSRPVRVPTSKCRAGRRAPRGIGAIARSASTSVYSRSVRFTGVDPTRPTRGAHCAK